MVVSGGTWLEPNSFERCFIDGNLITGANWSDHPEFISKLMGLLDVKVVF